MLALALHSFSDRATLLTLALAAALLASAAFLRRGLRLSVPGAWMRVWLADMERRLNRAHRDDATRRARGVLLALVLMALGALGGGALAALAAGGGWFAAIEILALAALLSPGAALERLARVRKALKEGDEAAARLASPPLTRRDLDAADAHTLARDVIEIAALAQTRLAGGVFWYAALGLPGACAVLALDFLAGVTVLPGERLATFSGGILRLHGAMMALPVRLAGLAIAFAALFVPACRAGSALRGIAAEPKGLGAVAGALRVALGGPRTLNGHALREPWADCGPARLGLADLARMQWLYAGGCAFWLLSAAALSLFL